MPTVIDWPEDVPSCVFPLSPQGGIKANRHSFETDSPLPPIERPIASWAPEQYSVELTYLTIEQFETFQRWFRNDLAYGAVPFKFRHPITNERRAWRFINTDPPYLVSKARRIPFGSNRRGVAITFTISTLPYTFDPDFLLQENSDYLLQENGDRIIIQEGNTFDPEEV